MTLYDKLRDIFEKEKAKSDKNFVILSINKLSMDLEESKQDIHDCLGELAKEYNLLYTWDSVRILK